VESRLINLDYQICDIEYNEFYLKDHLGNTRIRFADKDGDKKFTLAKNDNCLNEVFGSNHYYPFGMETEGPWLSPKGVENNYTYNGKEDVSGIGLLDYGFRYYNPSIGRFISTDPIAENFPHVSTFNYAENRVPNGIDLWGLQFFPAVNPAYMNLLSSGNNIHVRPLMTPKPSPKLRPKFTPEQIARFKRGNRIEGEQLKKMNLEKNTKPYTRTDPKTGKEGTTIPDAMKNGKQPVEIKNVKNQSLTKQLRLQREVAKDFGIDPILKINKDANLTKPLLEGGFQIEFYSQFGILEVESNNELSNEDLLVIRNFISTLEENQEEDK